MQGIIAFLKVLPDLIALYKHIRGHLKGYQADRFFKELNETFDMLSKSQTVDEKRMAAKRIRSLFTKLS